MLYAEMLKETENEETRLFCHIFFIDGTSMVGGGGSLGPLQATPTIVTSMLFVILKFCLLFCPCVHVKATLVVLFCMIMRNMRYYW